MFGRRTFPMLLAAAICVGVLAPVPPAAAELGGFQRETYVDTTRATPANGTYRGAPTRTLNVDFAVPAGNGPFPLVVYSHGSGSPFHVYRAVLESLADRGYLVAAPDFPLSQNQAPGGSTGNDRHNQPADVSFVIDRVLAGSSGGTGWLRGLVDPSRIAIAGSSLGGYTTLGVLAAGYTRIKAAVVEAPAVFPPRFALPSAYSGQNPPILFVHADRDTSVPMATTEGFYAQSRAPKFFATVKNADHFFLGDPAQGRQRVVFDTMASFFDVYLRGDRSGHLRLERLGRGGQLSLRGAVPCGQAAPGLRAGQTRC